MQRKFIRQSARFLMIALLVLIGASEGYSEDIYNGTELTIPSATVGNMTFSNIVVTPLNILSVGGGTANGSVDTYNPANNELNIPSVFYGGRTYTNVVITVRSLVSVGSVIGADFYNSQELNIRSVQVLGGAVYNNVIATVGEIVSIGGAMPTSVQDVYDPSTQRLTIAAIQLGSKIYTNALVTIGTVVALGGSPFSDSILYSFTGGTQGDPNSMDGGEPLAGMIQANDGNFYGTTSQGGGGNYGIGTVFKMTPAGVVSVIHAFGATNKPDGTFPMAGLIQGVDGALYGTTWSGGAYAAGTVYKITIAGIETELYSFFGGPDGANPTAGLVQGSDGNFYGTTPIGGSTTTGQGQGTVFMVTPAGVETVLYAFLGSPDGANPYGGLVKGSDGNFYGTTASGGIYNAGTVFRITPAGSETVLYSFSGSAGDGAQPMAGLAVGSDGNLYGTTKSGGPFTPAGGTVFKITPAGVETVLHFFSGNGGIPGSVDGAGPIAALIQGSDSNFYGTCASGGESNTYGVVFKITPSGLASVLHSFLSPPDGAFPEGSLVQGSDGNFYGTTELGGYTSGAVFKLANVIPPP